MTTFESPRDTAGNRLCEYCGDPVPKSLGTKPKRYCKRSCRQRAYEARQRREAIVTAVATAVARDRTSRDKPTRPLPTSRDVASPPVPAADPGEGWVRSIDEVDAQLRELEARQAAPRPPVPAPAPQKRRRLAPPSTAEAPTLFGPEAADGE